MKNFTKKGILQKTIIAILIVLSFNFIVPTYSSANVGGVLLSPIVDFLCTIGDTVINILQKSMTGDWGSSGALNMSFSAFLMESGEYYNSEYYVAGTKEGEHINPDKDFDKGWLGIKDEYYIPVATYSPEQIFTGNVPGLDINFINPKHDNGSASKLQPTIASWYIALRNLAIVGLLCVLVYVGIRIIISGTAGDKAKYKQMFMDWLVALCLVFFLHYIMSFILTFTETIVDTIGGDGTYTINITDDSAGKTFSTNLLGKARFKTQSKDMGEKLTYFAFYMALVAYTAIFTWHYLKRMLMMATLTLIAPFVALTYPIDKMGDGKAQAFNMWWKEYLYNSIIQIFHLILYTVFVGTAIDLVETSMLYGIACIAFILPAEKLLKKMFGFDRAPLGTMGALTGFALGSKFGGGKSSSGSKSTPGKSDKSSEDKPPRYQRKHGTDGINFDDTSGGPTPTGSQDSTWGPAPTGSPDPAGGPAPTASPDPAGGPTPTGSQDSTGGPAPTGSPDPAEGAAPTGSPDPAGGPAPTGNTNPTSGKVTFGQGMSNLVNTNGGKFGVAKKAVRKIGGVQKFATRTAFTAAGMALGAGAGLASGQGLAGVMAGMTAGKNLGSNLGRTVSNVQGNAWRTGKSAVNKVQDFKASVKDQWNGNTNAQDKLQASRFMKDESTQQYIRDKLAAENGGKAPSKEKLKEEMKNIRKYANEGMTDIEQIYRARKTEKFGVSEEQAAKIALLAQDRKITSDVLGDEKKYKQRQKDFTQEFINKGMSEADAAKHADYILNVMKAQVGQQHNLKLKEQKK